MNSALHIDPPMAICCEKLVHRYPDGRQALDGVSFSIQMSQRVALIGPNGAGKSTLLRHLNGLLRPTSGRILVLGQEVRPETFREIRRQIGFVFQDPNDQLFCPTVLEDVAFGPLHLDLALPEVVERARAALARVGLRDFEARAPHRLSAGEQRLVSLATVLSYAPPILVLDEPSTMLDPRNRRRLIQLLANLDGTQIIATHDLDLVWDLCARAVLLAGGRVVADGCAREILANRALLEANGLELPLRLADQRAS